MKYRHLKAVLDSLPEENLDQDLIVYITYEDEHVPAELVFATEANDVLDIGHPIIRTK